MTEKLTIPVEDLLLDVENPRIGAVGTQSEALEAIINLNADHFKRMLSSIGDHGLDPGDSFYVIADDLELGTYIVVDGNRRLSALKVLQNQALLNGTKATDGFKKAIANLVQAARSEGPESVDCVVFADRGEADDWIERRHGVGLDGESRIPWGTLEKQRFQHDRSILDVIDFVEKNSTFSDDEWAAVKRAVEAKPSVLSRFLESKSGRDWFGLAIEDHQGTKHPTFKADATHAIDFLSQLMKDIKDKVVDTRTYNKASDIEGYFTQHAKPGKPSATAQRFGTALVSDGKKRPRQRATPASTSPKPTVRTSRPKPPRSTLAPARHQFSQPQTEKGLQLVRECSKVRLDQPLSSAFLLRAFLQHSIDAYMTEHGISFHEKGKDGKTVQLDLGTRFERTYAHLVSNKIVSGSDLHGVKSTLTAKTDPASIQSLNDYHHDRYRIPSGDVLRNAWDSAEALFIAVYGKA